MRLIFIFVCVLGVCIARADVYYDFETPATSPVWLGTTQIVQNTSASHTGTNAIAFTGGPYGGANAEAYIQTELPQNTTNVEFYFYDDYGPNPPLYQYLNFYLLQDTDSAPFAGFSMLDGGWGTAPPKTANHYYAWGQEAYDAGNLGPVRTVGWHKFTFVVGAGSVAMLVDGTLVFQTNVVQTARYLGVSLVTTGWGRMDDLDISTGVWPPRVATASAVMTNGVVVGANITDGGYGYTNPPTVRIIGGGGTGASAIANVTNGIVTSLTITSAGSGYTNAPHIVIESPPFTPTVSIAVSAVKVTQHVRVNHNYVLEASNDLTTWTATGPAFTAQAETITNEFEVDSAGKFFRIREVP